MQHLQYIFILSTYITCFTLSKPKKILWYTKIENIYKISVLFVLRLKNIFCLLFRKFIFGKKTEVKFSTFAEGMAHGGVGASGKVSGRYTDKKLREFFLICFRNMEGSPAMKGFL